MLTGNYIFIDISFIRMRNFLLIFGLLFLILSGFTAIAQEPLSLSASIENAIKNNYSIQISRNDSTIAANNNSSGNAGMLPSVDVTAGITKAVVNTNQEYSNGNIVKQSGANSDGINAGAHLNWVLFDGLKMFAAKSRLNAEADYYGVQLKIEIENTVAGVMENYFRAVSLLQDIRVLDSAIAIFDERVRIAELRFEVGSGSKLDLLQSQTDRNARKSLRLQQLLSYNNALASLNRLMGKNDFVSWRLTDSIVVSYKPTLDDLKKTVPLNNFELQAVKKQEETFKYRVDEVRALRYPLLNLNVDYNYSRTENEVGFALLNQNQGLYSGLTLSWNLFNGWNTNRQIKNAKLSLISASLLLSDTRLKIDQQLYVAFYQYEAEQEILELETQNAAVATENIKIALESFRLGSISGLQLKDAQNSYEAAMSRLISSKLQAKLSEITLMRLNGELVK